MSNVKVEVGLNHNRAIVELISRTDLLLPCYLKALDDVETTYDNVGITTWSDEERHAIYKLKLRCCGQEAYGEIWADEESLSTKEVYYKIIAKESGVQLARKIVYLTKDKNAIVSDTSSLLTNYIERPEFGRNEKIIRANSKSDILLPCYIALLKDLERRYRIVWLKLWGKSNGHMEYWFDIEYKRNAAQAMLLGYGGDNGENAEVVCKVRSLLSNKCVAVRRACFDDNGKIVLK